MICSGWGKFPQVDCEKFTISQHTNLHDIIVQHDSSIPFGNGRSYGDSALGEHLLNLRHKDFFLALQ